MPVQIGAGPQADFSQPIDLLMDCHRRIERFLEMLLRVVDDTGGGVLDDEHRRALIMALNYFRSAAPRHTQDEEESLFPRMRQSGDPAATDALARLETLEADHRAQEIDHARVDALGLRWLADGRLPRPEAEELRDVLTRLRGGYQRHIRLEDEEVFPLAARVLSGAALAATGAEMKQRRAADPGRKESRCGQRRRALGASSE